MSERSVVITEENGTYKIHNPVLNEFELLGLLEQIVFDLKYSRQAGKSPEENRPSAKRNSKPISQEAETSPPAVSNLPGEKSIEARSAAPERIAGVSGTAATDLQTRIGKAVKAIRDLGGSVEITGLAKMTADELQTTLEELTAQYKKLKNSNGSK